MALWRPGHQAIGVRCDVSNESQVAELTDRTVAIYGRLDMAFNNAGIQVPPSDAADEPAEVPSRKHTGDVPVQGPLGGHRIAGLRCRGRALDGAVSTSVKSHFCEVTLHLAAQELRNVP